MSKAWGRLRKFVCASQKVRTLTQGNNNTVDLLNPNYSGKMNWWHRTSLFIQNLMTASTVLNKGPYIHRHVFCPLRTHPWLKKIECRIDCCHQILIKGRNFEVLWILNWFQNMIKPWNLKIWALCWWDQANQILTYSRQKLILLVVIYKLLL